MCRGVAKSCQSSAPCPSFECVCAGPYGGPLCQLYQRCYDDVGQCFFTGYAPHDFAASKSHCSRLGFHAPVILSTDVDRAFDRFLSDDPRGVLQNESIWLGAQSQPMDPSAEWTWIDQTNTGMRSLYAFKVTGNISEAMPRKNLPGDNLCW